MHVLSVSSLKGGVGKTTVSLGLASAAFTRGLKTLVVDLDPQHDASSGLGAIGVYRETCAEVLENPKHNIVHRAIVSSSWALLHPGVMDVMVGSEKIRALDTPNPSVRDLWKLEEALYRVESDYDLVIIDTPPSLNALTRTAWAASDRVLVVSEPAMFSVVASYRAVSAIKEMQAKLNPRVATAGVVVNRYLEGNQEHEFRLGELKEVFGNGLLQPYFEDIPQVQQAQGAGRPIHLWPGDVAQRIASSFDHVLNQVIASFNLHQPAEPQQTTSRFSRFKKVMRGSGLESVIKFESDEDKISGNQDAINRIIEMQNTEEAIKIETPTYVYVPGGRKSKY